MRKIMLNSSTPIKPLSDVIGEIAEGGVFLCTWQNLFWLPKFDNKVAVYCPQGLLQIQYRLQQKL